MEKLTDREVREKLVSRGVQSLSDRELLSIILGEGSAGYSAEPYLAAESAVMDTGAAKGAATPISPQEIEVSDMTRLRMTEGIGVKRAAVLTAVFELAGRLHRQEAAAPASIRTKDDVTALFAPLLARLPHEEMWALYLSSANGVIEKMRVSQGGVTALVVDYKLIVKRAVEVLASSLIIVHNHPSGVAAPSPEDISITKRIGDAAALFDIGLVDHIIIADGSSYSFRQYGLIK